MQCLVIFALSALAAVQASPFINPMGMGYGMGMGGLGLGGLGLGGLGMGYGSGGGYLHNGYANGQNGFHRGGYGGGMTSVGHDIGHTENDFDSAVHQHHSSGHNIGGMMQGGHGGSEMGGYGGYGAGSTGMGNGWSEGGFF